MSVIQAALMDDLSFTALRDTLYAHTTLAGSLNKLFGALPD